MPCICRITRLARCKSGCAAAVQGALQGSCRLVRLWFVDAELKLFQTPWGVPSTLKYTSKNKPATRLGRDVVTYGV